MSLCTVPSQLTGTRSTGTTQDPGAVHLVGPLAAHRAHREGPGDYLLSKLVVNLGVGEPKLSCVECRPPAVDPRPSAQSLNSFCALAGSLEVRLGKFHIPLCIGLNTE